MIKEALNIASFSENTRFEKDSVRLFAHLSEMGTKANTMMLESADIVTHKGENSTIITSAAIKATCIGNQVTFLALNSNGVFALEHLRNNSPKNSKCSKNSLVINYPSPRSLNLDTRLKEPSVLDAIRAMVFSFSPTAKELRKSFLLAGIFSYDLIDVFETLPEASRDELEFPNFVFWLPDTLITLDHKSQNASIIGHVFDRNNHTAIEDKKKEISRLTTYVRAQNENKNENLALDSFSPILPTIKEKAQKAEPKFDAELEISDPDFALLVERLKQNISSGDVFQIVPSRTFKVDCKNPFESYLRLRKLNPSPYMYYAIDEDFILLGASPETFIKVSGDPKRVDIRPIAGTRKRGFKKDGTHDLELDTRREAELKLDEKELAEHMMLVDLARNDVARVSKAGTRAVENLLGLDRYSHVMHLVTHVVGSLRDDLDALHAYQASLNMGTLMGAPKIKAAEILRKVESSKRGPYGGSIGYINNEGDMDTAITIRSALIKNGKAYIRAGAGVVFDSIPDAEVQETKMKAQAVLQAMGA